MLSEFQRAIRTDKKRKLLAAKATNDDLQTKILKATPKAIQQTKNVAHRLQGTTLSETAENVHRFIRKNFVYLKDDNKTGQQLIQPSRLVRQLYGDCKSFSLLCYSLLFNLGLKPSYKLAGYDVKKKFLHISTVLFRMKTATILLWMELVPILTMNAPRLYHLPKNTTA